MNLVKQLPIGLGLACMVMLASCSKDDTQTPAPQVGDVKKNSGLREGGPGWIDALPQIAPTMGPTGQGVYAPGWSKNYGSLPASPQVLPSGTSNSKYLWGNPNLPWVKPIPANPAIPNNASFITVAAIANSADFGTVAAAQAQIKHLKPGKKYSITYYAINSITNASDTYPNNIGVLLHKCDTDLLLEGSGCTFGNNYGTGVGASDSGVWIKKTFEFVAPSTSMTMSIFSSSLEGQGYFSVYVDKNSIKQLN